MLTLVLPRLVSFEGAGRRSASVAERNVAALKSAYWVVLISGFFEPLLYLLSIGVGVGGLVGSPPPRCPARCRKRHSTSSGK